MKPTEVLITAAMFFPLIVGAQTGPVPGATNAMGGARATAAQVAAWKERAERIAAEMAERKEARLATLPTVAEVNAASTNLTTLPGWGLFPAAEKNQTGVVSTNPAVRREIARRVGAMHAAQQAERAKAAHLESENGAAVGRFGRHQVTFAATTAGGIDLQIPTGERLRSRVLGLCYLSDDGRSVWLANLVERPGEVLLPRRVIYRDALQGERVTDVDLEYEYTANFLEQNVVVRKNLPPPQVFNLDAARTKLAVVTEFFEAPEPRQTPRTISLKEDYAALGITSEETVPDVTLRFTSMAIGKGKAFGRGTKGKEVPVFKSWQVVQEKNGTERRFLIESVPFRLIQPQLDELSAAVRSETGGSQLASTALQPIKDLLLNCKPPGAGPGTQGETDEEVGGSANASSQLRAEGMKLALAGPDHTPAVVLDYVIVDTWETGGVWFDDALPADASENGDNEWWSWTDYWYDGDGWEGYALYPYSGTMMHVSDYVPDNYHQHGFYYASEAILPGSGDVLYAWVYLDPSYPPQEVMLQWHADWDGEHRAYWGGNYLDWGTDGTESRYWMGDLPPTWGWMLLEVPASVVGLEGKVINGMSFVLYGGRAAWDQAGLVVSSPGGLVARWRGDGNAQDDVGNNPGTLTGNTTYSTGKVNQAFHFDGLNAAVDLGNPTAVQWPNFTIEAWIRRDSATQTTLTANTNGMIFSGGWGAYGFMLCNNGQLGLSQIGLSAVTSTLTVTDTNWHHVAVSKSPSGVSFFVDGAEEYIEGYSPTFDFGLSFAIGARGDDRSAPFLGSIDEVCVYRGALTALEVEDHYLASGGVPRPTVNVSASVPNAQEPSDNGQFTITRDGDTNSELTITFTMGGSAVNGTDYAQITSPVTFPVGVTSTNILLTTADRPGNQGTRTAILSLQNNQAYRIGTNAQACVTLLDVAGLPACAAWPMGLANWWQGEGNPYDALGNSIGFPVGNLSYEAGKVGQCFRFDGVNSSVNLGPLQPPFYFTIEAWVKRASTTQATLTGYPNSVILCGGWGSFGFMIYNNGRLGLTKVGYSSVNTTTLAVTDTNWHHVTVSWHCSYGVAFTVDGVVEYAGAYNPSFQPNSPVAIGDRGDGRVHPFYGCIDEVSVYAWALNGWVQTLYAAGAAGKCYTKPAVSVWVSEADCREPDNPGQFTIARSGAPLGDLSVSIVPGGNAFWGGDCTLSPCTFSPYQVTIPNGQSSTTVAVIPRGDSLYELDETVTLQLGSGDAYNLGSAGGASLTILDTPHISVTASDALAGEPADNGQFTLARSGQMDREVTVAFTMEGTAVNGIDYATLPGSVTFPVGITATNITLSVLDRACIQAWRDAKLRLSYSTNYNFSFDGEATVSIGDDDTDCVEALMNLVAWWRAEGDALDALGTHHGTLLGDVSFGSGWYVGQGFYFGGTTGRVEVANAPALNPTNGLTIEGWVYFSPEAAGVASIVVSKGTGMEQYMLMKTWEDKLSGSVRLNHVGFSESRSVESTNVLTPDSWHHVAMTWDAADGQLWLYLDGAPDQTADAVGTLIINSQPLCLGGAPWAESWGWHNWWGGLDELSLYNRALSADEIGTVYWRSAIGVVRLPPCNPYCVPVVTVTSTVPTAREGVSAGAFTIRRQYADVNADLPVTVVISGTASNGVDYSEIPSMVTIPRGQYSTTVTVGPPNDDEDEPDETVELTILPCSAYTLGASNTATVTILDEAHVNVVASDSVARRPFDYGVFTLTRDGPTGDPLTVYFGMVGTAWYGTDYTTAPPRNVDFNPVTFPAGSSNTTVTVVPTDGSGPQVMKTAVLVLMDTAGYTLAYTVGTNRATVDFVDPGFFDDADGDNLPDGWESLHFSNLSHSGEADDDNDGLTNIQEYESGANPLLADTDGDGMNDGLEVAAGRDPTMAGIGLDWFVPTKD